MSRSIMAISSVVRAKANWALNQEERLAHKLVPGDHYPISARNITQLPVLIRADSKQINHVDQRATRRDKGHEELYTFFFDIQNWITIWSKVPLKSNCQNLLQEPHRRAQLHPPRVVWGKLSLQWSTLDGRPRVRCNTFTGTVSSTFIVSMPSVCLQHSAYKTYDNNLAWGYRWFPAKSS